MAGRKRILIADDDPEIVDLLESYFHSEGYEVEVAVNGKDALLAVNKSKFDLVLLDVMMPYVDGYHVAGEITAKFGQDSPKIIIISSRDMASERGTVLLGGACEAVQKPFTLDEIGGKVKALLAQP